MQYELNLDPAAKHRRRVAEILTEAVEDRGLTKKQFRLRLSAHGVHVSRQAVDCWLNGETLPSVHHQAGIARALDIPPRSLFPFPEAS